MEGKHERLLERQVGMVTALRASLLVVIVRRSLPLRLEKAIPILEKEDLLLLELLAVALRVLQSSHLRFQPLWE